MVNIKTLKLKKEFNLKEYLNKKKKMDKAYNEYVNNLINKAEQSIKEGRVRPIECIIKEIEKEYGLMPR